jgi:hypothetical protein
MTARSEAIEAAARQLIQYEEIGRPDFPNWDRYFDALRAALDAWLRSGRII